MPDYTITANPETHEFTVDHPGKPYISTVTLFPFPKCVSRMRHGEIIPGYLKSSWQIDAVQDALIDALNAPEKPENKLLIETAYIPLKVAHRRRERQKKAISNAPIEEAVKRQDWMD